MIADIPAEVQELKEKNRKYSEMIMKQFTVTPEELQMIKSRLNLAPTPKQEIYSECTIKLYRFTPVKKKLHKVPVLLVPSIILKYYIMDLRTGHSLIEHLINSGVDTYLIDWGVPGDEYGKLTLDYYIDTFIRRAVRKVSRLTGCEKINILGQCLGGTFAAIFSALYPEKVNKLVTLTTPVDFEDAGILSLWTDPRMFNVDNVVDSFENVIPPDFIHSCFQFLDVEATVARYKKLYDNVLDENFMYSYRAMDTWLSDKIPFPCEVFRSFIKDFYQKNKLAKGCLMINGRNADLANIKSPVLNVIAENDHVFPVKSALKLSELVGGEAETHIIPAGHVTLITLFPVRETTYKIISDFLSDETSKDLKFEKLETKSEVKELAKEKKTKTRTCRKSKTEKTVKEKKATENKTEPVKHTPLKPAMHK
jgi:polyhydroxyalkanoate synthase subunit PhaC